MVATAMFVAFPRRYPSFGKGKITWSRIHGQFLALDLTDSNINSSAVQSIMISSSLDTVNESPLVVTPELCGDRAAAAQALPRIEVLYSVRFATLDST
jgi:hypothetical protein